MCLGIVASNVYEKFLFDVNDMEKLGFFDLLEEEIGREIINEVVFSDSEIKRLHTEAYYTAEKILELAFD